MQLRIEIVNLFVPVNQERTEIVITQNIVYISLILYNLNLLYNRLCRDDGVVFMYMRLLYHMGREQTSVEITMRQIYNDVLHIMCTKRRYFYSA